MNETLYLPREPWFLRMCCSHSELTDFLWEVTNDTSLRIVSRIFRGARIRSEQDLYDEFSAACQFPYYFGNNWDALSECITDLEWLPADAYVFALSDFDQVLKTLGEDMSILLRLLDDAAKEWSTPVKEGEEWDRPARAFHVILHAVPEHRSELEEVSKVFEFDCPEIQVR